MISPYLDAALLIWLYMSLVFVLALWLKDNGIVDVAWGLGFVGLSWWMHLFYPATGSVWAAGLTTVWGIRLAGHIGLRNARKGVEDWRYANWREQWGRWVVVRAYLQVFMLQGFFMWVIALPLLQRPAPAQLYYPTLLAGLAIWLLGFGWEAVGDWQLLRFKARPENRGKIMTSGLWALSRHPNYFGEIVLWWGLWLVLWGHGQWWLSVLSPLTLTWLLTRVSGVPMLEKKYLHDPVYQDYQRRTPALVPWKWGLRDPAANERQQ